MTVLYSTQGLSFSYPLGKEKVTALKGVSFDIQAGDFVCLSGPSGSGKSTLLNLLGLIEPVQEGRLLLSGRDLKDLSDAEKNQIRKFDLGFVFQSFHLFPVLTAQENVEYFLYRQGLKASERNQRVKHAIESVGLWDHRHKKPNEMSGGQRQRVAVARAIAKKPRVIIADEPTASLDQKTGAEIMKLFMTFNRDLGTTFVVSSHDPMVQNLCKNHLRLRDGVLVGDDLASAHSAHSITETLTPGHSS
jgi:putative ABC transport system ATP-binding protein